MRSTMYQKAPFCSSEMAGVKISSLACKFSPVEIFYSDYSKSFISTINEVYFFPIKITIASFLRHLLWNVATICFVQSNLLLCWHGFCHIIKVHEK